VPHRKIHVAFQNGNRTGRITDIVVAIFADHRDAQFAVVQLFDVGFGTAGISIVGRGFSRQGSGPATTERASPTRYANKRIPLWEEMDSSLFETDLVSATPAAPVFALGYLAKRAADFAGGDGAATPRLGTALSRIGIPGDHVVRYEFAVHANGCLLMVHGDGIDIARARTILRCATPASIDVHAVRPVPTIRPEPGADRVLSEAAAALR
jgi:hypothetical protein